MPTKIKSWLRVNSKKDFIEKWQAEKYKITGKAFVKNRLEGSIKVQKSYQNLLTMFPIEPVSRRLTSMTLYCHPCINFQYNDFSDKS